MGYIDGDGVRVILLESRPDTTIANKQKHREDIDFNLD
jgi:hypothetical protein